jgi:hypothetical protein
VFVFVFVFVCDPFVRKRNEFCELYIGMAKTNSSALAENRILVAQNTDTYYLAFLSLSVTKSENACFQQQPMRNSSFFKLKSYHALVTLLVFSCLVSAAETRSDNKYLSLLFIQLKIF